MEIPAALFRADSSGFTLIELSVVLVIIGLIVGGILVGQNLIHAAQLQKTISQIQQYTSAVNTFRAKYNCLPGDCANATDFLPTDPNGCPPFLFTGNAQNALAGTCNGDGDGIILGACTHYGQFPACFEELYMWEDLSLANLINFQPNYGATPARPFDEPGGSVPGLPLQGTGIALYHDQSQFRSPTVMGYQWSIGTIGANQYINYPSLSANDARALDTKMDDGLPNSGSVIGYTNNWAVTNCTDGSVYLNDDTLVVGQFGCALYVQSGL